MCNKTKISFSFSPFTFTSGFPTSWKLRSIDQSIYCRSRGGGVSILFLSSSTITPSLPSQAKPSPLEILRRKIAMCNRNIYIFPFFFLFLFLYFFGLAYVRFLVRGGIVDRMIAGNEFFDSFLSLYIYI